MDQVKRVGQPVLPVLCVTSSTDGDADTIKIQALVHLVGRPVNVGVEALKRLLDRQQKDNVDEDDAVVADQEEHLKALSPAVVVAVRSLVHLLYQHVAPDIESKHPWHHHQ